MKIEHAALFVNDLEAERDFFIKYVEPSACEKYENPSRGFYSYLLSFGRSCRLELFHYEGKTKPELPEYFHLAFSAGSQREVDLLTDRLQKDGYVVESDLRPDIAGDYLVCVLDSEGNRVEITV